MTELPPAVREYLSSKHVLVVDPSAAFNTNIIVSLASMGINHSQIHATGRYEDALSIIDRYSPHLLISEYFIGKHFGLKLFEEIDRRLGESNRIGIIVTSNASDSAIAEAAEGQVDAYILKPFSLGDFRKKLQETLTTKITPSDYVLSLRKGREALDLGDFERAIKEFEAAKKLGNKPSLAHFYSGLTHHVKQNHHGAIDEFKSGLKITPLHYRCLIGKFDSWFQLKKFPEAHKLIRDIKENYPISPQRLINFFITSVYTNNFQDLVQYYELYKDLAHRPPELVKIATVSMRTAGRFYLKDNNPKKAFEFYDLGVTLSGLDPDVLDTTIKELLKAQTALANQAASDLYRKYPRQHVGSERHALIGFLIDAQILKAEDGLEKGKKIMNQFKGDADFYRKMVSLAKELGKKTMAEDLITKAISYYPDLRKELYDLLEA